MYKIRRTKSSTKVLREKNPHMQFNARIIKKKLIHYCIIFTASLSAFDWWTKVSDFRRAKDNNIRMRKGLFKSTIYKSTCNLKIFLQRSFFRVFFFSYIQIFQFFFSCKLCSCFDSYSSFCRPFNLITDWIV